MSQSEFKEAQVADYKLYVVTRDDLPPNYQIPQVAHVVAEFGSDFIESYNAWHKGSNSIVVVSTKNEKELYELAKKLDKKGLQYSKFLEPDIGWALTALAIIPCEMSKKMCSNLPLAGKKNTPNAQEVLSKTFDVVDAMIACEQSSGQSILDHGLSVRDYLFDLLGFFRGNKELEKDWRLPDWLIDNRKNIVNSLMDDYTLEKYTIFHDCAKPFIKTIDEDGRVHFPDHANASADLWKAISDDAQIEKLIRMDMIVHTMKAEEIPEFCKNKETISLLLVGLAEIHSNAKMFGGLESNAFKIKWKHLEKRGRTICKQLFE